MSIMPDNSIIVSDITGNTLKIRVRGDDVVTKMKNIGFLQSNDFMVKSVESEGDKLDLIRDLVKVDALFLFGYGWYPSEVMANYKEKGLYVGKYKFISWSDSRSYKVEEK